MISAVIFDLDGLLLDSEVYWERARQAYGASAGCTWTAHDELDAKGMSSPEWAALIRERCGLETELNQVIAGVTARMRELYEAHLPLFPGAVDTVRAAATRYPLGLASSSPRELIEQVLSEAELRADFSVIVSSDEVARGKPSPDVFLEAARQLEVEPEQIAVFEDSSAGIRAARDAGMHVIAVPNAHYPPSAEALALADLVLPSLKDFSLNVVTGL